MRTSDACRTCGCNLIVEENWYPSQAQKRNRVCKSCFLARGRKHHWKNRKRVLEFRKQRYQDRSDEPEFVAGRMLDNARARERRRNVPKNLRMTKDQRDAYVSVVARELADGAWSGVFKRRRGKGTRAESPTLSRIDSTKGYVNNFVVEPMSVNNVRDESGVISDRFLKGWPKNYVAKISNNPLICPLTPTSGRPEEDQNDNSRGRPRGGRTTSRAHKDLATVDQGPRNRPSDVIREPAGVDAD